MKHLKQFYLLHSYATFLRPILGQTYTCIHKIFSGNDCSSFCGIWNNLQKTIETGSECVSRLQKCPRRVFFFFFCPIIHLSHCNMGHVVLINCCKLIFSCHVFGSECLSLLEKLHIKSKECYLCKFCLVLHTWEQTKLLQRFHYTSWQCTP